MQCSVATRFLLFFYENNESSSEHVIVRRQKVMHYCMDELLNCQQRTVAQNSKKVQFREATRTV